MEDNAAPIDKDGRKPWSTPQVIVSEIRDTAMPTFKSNPSWVDYLTGISHVGGS